MCVCVFFNFNFWTFSVNLSDLLPSTFNMEIQSKMKLQLFSGIFIVIVVIFQGTCVHGIAKPDYYITGQVESISYSTDPDWPCYISIENASSSKNLYFHASKVLSVCQFAERCRDSKIPVKLGSFKDPLNTDITTVEYANTNAKYVYDN